MAPLATLAAVASSMVDCVWRMVTGNMAAIMMKPSASTMTAKSISVKAKPRRGRRAGRRSAGGVECDNCMVVIVSRPDLVTPNDRPVVPVHHQRRAVLVQPFGLLGRQLPPI